MAAGSRARSSRRSGSRPARAHARGTGRCGWHAWIRSLRAVPRAGGARYSGWMAFDRSRTLRGALAGTAAAAVWHAQQPLDQRVFRCGYDDPELLARLAGSGYAVGTVLHLANGAAFGALYANVASRLPGPPVVRGALAGL